MNIQSLIKSFITFALLISSNAYSASVFVQTVEGALTDPFHIEFNDSDKRAVADIRSGQFKVIANEVAGIAYAGLFQPI